MSKIFILGSSGFIGAKLYNYLTRENQSEILTVGRSGEDVFVDLDNDYDELIRVTEAQDFVVFLSSISAPDICSNKPELAYKVNVTATIDLIKQLAIKGVRVIFASTDVVFGHYNCSAHDDSPLNPFGAYAKMKAEVENEFLGNENVKFTRFSYVIGKGDKYTTLMAEFNETGNVLEVFDGFERNVVSLNDVMEGIHNMIQNWCNLSFQCINFCGPKLISREEITKLFSNEIFQNIVFKLVPAPLNFWDSRPKIINVESLLFSNLLGRELTSLEQNIKNWSEQ